MSLIGGLIGGAGKIIDELHTSKEEKAEAELERYKAETARSAVQQRERLARLDIEREVAKSQGTAQWRPAVGRTCNLGLLYALLIQPLAAWVTGIVGGFAGLALAAPPALDGELLVTVLAATLGMGGLRTAEKWRGVEHRR